MPPGCSPLVDPIPLAQNTRLHHQKRSLLLRQSVRRIQVNRPSFQSVLRKKKRQTEKEMKGQHKKGKRLFKHLPKDANPSIVTFVQGLIFFVYLFSSSSLSNMLRTIQSRHLIRPFTKYAISKHRCLATVAQDLENAYDVVIIGGGVAGATLACSLGNHGNWIYMTCH